MINKELLSRHRIDKLKTYLMKGFLKEVNDTVEDIKNSERYAAAAELVQESPEFKKEMDKLKERLIASLAAKELGITLSEKWAAERRIKEEIDAKLAVTKIGTFEDISKSIKESIQVEDFIG